MKFFLDSICLKDIACGVATGFIDGITTNPSLLATAEVSAAKLKERIQEICRLVEGPISVEVESEDFEGMLREAKQFVSWGQQVVVKLPLTPDGLKACRVLRDQGIEVNVTLCFSVVQALLAAKAGATYISPFVGRLDDAGISGVDLLAEIRDCYDTYGFSTQILAASIRHPQHVAQALTAGADVATMPLKVLQQLYQHPMTQQGLAIFREHAKGIEE